MLDVFELEGTQAYKMVFLQGLLKVLINFPILFYTDSHGPGRWCIQGEADRAEVEPNVVQSGADVLLCTIERTNAGFFFIFL